MAVKPALDELDEMRARRTTSYQLAVLRLAAALAQPSVGANAVLAAEDSLGRVIAEAGRWANVLGRRRTVLEVGELAMGYAAYAFPWNVSRFSIPAPTFFPMAYAAEAERIARVEFAQATDDILSRAPVIRRGYEAVQKLYNEQYGFALAKSCRLTMTEKIQKLIGSFLKSGEAAPKFETIMEQLAPWSRAYAETVFRTNLATAYASGRMQQAVSPELDEFIPAIRRVATLDSDTRPNHRAAHGLIAKKRDPIWLKLGVPSGFACRCSWQLLDVVKIERGRIHVPARAVAPPGAFNDPGFQTRVGFEVWGA